MARDGKQGGRKQPPRRPAAQRRRGGLAELFSMDSERQARLLLIGVTAIIVIGSLALIGFGYYYSVIKPRHRTVLEADGIKVSYSAMKRRMAYDILTNTQLQSEASRVLPEISFNNVLKELTLVRRAESELGITLTEEEQRQRLSARLGVSEEAGGQAFAEALKRALDSSRLHEDEFRRLVLATGLEEKVRQKFTSEAPANEPQARLEVIVTTTREDADEAIGRLRFGATWADVAKQLSRETDVQTTGGLKDFDTRDSIDLNYQNYAFTAPIGEISDPPLEGSNVFYVVRVVERKDADTTDAQKANYGARRFNEWLEATQLKMTIERDWEPDAQEDALVSVLNSVEDDIVAQRQAQEEQQNQPTPLTTISLPTEGPEAQPTTAPEPQPTAVAPADGQ